MPPVENKVDSIETVVIRQPHTRYADATAVCRLDQDENSEENVKPSRRQAPKDKRVAWEPDKLRKMCLELLTKHPQVNLDWIVENFNQPKEPVKRVLEELCTFDKPSKSYKLKSEFVN